jgi:hypothetical protein
MPAEWADAQAQPSRSSTLDRVVTNFRDHWETDAAYRGRVSVMVGAGALISLCLLVGVVAVIASSMLGGGAPSPASVAQSGHGGQLQGFASFPTPSLAPWTPGTIPGAAPAPASQTPIPKPTSAVTPTPTIDPNSTATTSATGGGLPTTCNGQVGSTTWAITPCPQQAGQGGSMSIHAPGNGNAPINVLISFGVCSGNANCTYTFLPSSNHLDGSGSITLSYTVPAAAAHNSAPVSGMVNIQNGPNFSFTAAPVQ